MTAKPTFVALWVVLAILPAFGFVAFVPRHCRAKTLLSAATETEQNISWRLRTN
jgi:hypothetical protein